MKTFPRYLIAVLMTLSLCVTYPVQATVTHAHPTTAPVTTPITAEVQRMLTRLETIQAMDMKGMERAEKRMLRKEVKEIKSSLQAANNTVYLSVGAIIIIVLLIILLL